MLQAAAATIVQRVKRSSCFKNPTGGSRRRRQGCEYLVFKPRVVLTAWLAEIL